jgi:DNA-binding LytR/AlgR family response regulator
MKEKPYILVVDDDPNIARLVALYLEKENYEVRTVGRGDDAVNEFTRLPPDLILLDVMLPGMDGFEICRRIREKNPSALIVYVSAYQQYALLCCQSHAFDFLLKPWTDQQLADCLRAIRLELVQRRSEPALQVTLGTRLLRLPYAQVLYFSKDHMSLTAHFTDGHQLAWRETAEDLLKRLPDGQFIRTHKSYIVSLRHIRELRWAEDRVVLDDGTELPISRRRETVLKGMLSAQQSGGKERC